MYLNVGSLYCIPEINIIFCVNYISIRKKSDSVSCPCNLWHFMLLGFPKAYIRICMHIDGYEC